MDIEQRAWLYDIYNSILEIDSFFNNQPKVFSSFQADLKTKRAVERDLEIIGEAISRLMKADNTIAISNSRKIIGTRNRIIHDYDNISDEMIWSIVINHLPILKAEVEAIINTAL